MDSRTCLLLVFLLSQQLCVCAADQGSSPTAPSSLSSLSGGAVVNTVCTVSERTNEALVPSAGAKPYTNLLVYGDGRESVGKACCGACSTNVTGCGAYSVKIKRTANPTKKDKGMCRLYDHAAAATLSVKKCNSAAGQECASARVPDSHTSRTSSGKQRGNAYLRYKDVEYFDTYSAAWLMNVARFKGIETERITRPVGACTGPFSQYSKHVRMTRDWFELAVEHLSKWWKSAGIESHVSGREAFLDRLQQVETNGNTRTNGGLLKNTIAIVSFVEYKGGTKDGQEFTAAVLAACVRSLSRYGMGRVVVVVPSEVEQTRYSRMMTPNCCGTTLVFRVADVKMANGSDISPYGNINVPLRALIGLQNAFETDSDNWLGNTKEQWSSVYYTEQDQLLHIKPNVLPELIHGVVEDGWVLSPHRLHPLPHASDLPYTDLRTHQPRVPNNEKHQVRSVNSYASRCMDAGNARPKKGCGNFWWICAMKNLTFLEPYELMRLSPHSTGITLVVGNEQGRMCRIDQDP